jgi:outer membrane protein assembly factor BamB
MHHITRLGITLAAGIAMAACAPANTTPPVKPNTPLPVAWQTRVGDSLNEIALHAGMAFVVNETNRLIALDAKTGAKQWEANLNLVNSRQNAVGVDGGRVFALTGREDVSVVAFDAKTGRQLWTASTGQHKGTHHPTASDGRVFFDAPAADGEMEVRAVDAATGKDAWSFRLNGSPATGMVAENGALYLGVNQWDGATVKARRVIALDAATGALRWEAPLDLDVNGGLSADADRVYIGMNGGVVQARDAATGEPAWTARAGGRLNTAPSVIDRVAYAGNSDGMMTALNAGDGTQLWQNNVGSAVLTQVAGADSVVYFGTNDGTLFALDAASGAMKWQVQSPERRPVVPGPYVPAMGTTPAVFEDLLLFFNGDALNALKLR